MSLCNNIKPIQAKDKGISICITAYKSVDTIKETLDSVISQTWFKIYKNWEILLGIDHCEETLDYIKTIMNNYKNLRVFMMDSNQGTYVTTNTLFKIAKYENLLRFDSDDVMFSNMVEELMNNEEEYDLQRFRLIDIKTYRMLGYFSWGQQFVKKYIFEKFGGYRPWPCAADAEFIQRISNFININLLDKPLFLYRTSPNSLTQNKATSMHSITRLKLIKIIKTSKYENEDDAKIECITNTYKEIFSNIHQIDPEIYINDVKPVVLDESKIIVVNKKYKNLKRQRAVKVKNNISITNTPSVRRVRILKLKR